MASGFAATAVFEDEVCEIGGTTLILCFDLGAWQVAEYFGQADSAAVVHPFKRLPMAYAYRKLHCFRCKLVPRSGGTSVSLLLPSAKRRV